MAASVFGAATVPVRYVRMCMCGCGSCSNIIIMVVRLLLPALMAMLASTGGVLALQCTLTDTQKFDPSCEGIVSYASGTVFQGEEISLNFHLPNSSNGELSITTPTNTSVFSSAENFCGYESFSEGETCSISHLIVNGLQNIRLVVVCSGSPEAEVSYGPAVLVLGFQAPYSCNVRLNITWGQSEFNNPHTSHTMCVSIISSLDCIY